MLSDSSKEKTEHPVQEMLGFSSNAVNIRIVASTFLPGLVPEPGPLVPFRLASRVPGLQVRVPEQEQASSPLPSGSR
jgi:hypothetical protein